MKGHVVEGDCEPLRVTVAITTHNRCELLKRALVGVQAQTYRNLEILVSDDASSDGTQELMAEVHDPRVLYLRIEKPVGIAGNFQNALNHASGELFMILNDDDELEPEAIEGLARPFWEPPDGLKPEEIVLSWCPCKIQDGERRVKYVTTGGPTAETGIDFVTGVLNGERGPRFCGILLRTKDAAAIGYLPRYGGIPDFGNWTRVAVRGGIACCVDGALARYTAHSASCTGTSTSKSWQRAGEAIYDDLLSDLQGPGDEEKRHRIERSRRNHISGLLLAVLMHQIGRPGWKIFLMKEILRAPQYYVTPMTVRRLLLEGGKLFRKGR